MVAQLSGLFSIVGNDNKFVGAGGNDLFLGLTSSASFDAVQVLVDFVCAVDGEEGVNMATSESPDLILMDMSLPVLDGWEATRRIKADETTKSLPVIALTAHAMEGDEQKAREAGCDDYDTKPVELPRLLGKIEALLGG